MRSPFTGLRFARMELDNFRAGKMIKLAIVAISLIPLIYGGLFLLAFLDPYGNLVNVPAAVVNLDEGAEVDGEQRNVGQELCDELVKNNEDAKPGQPTGFDWKFVNEEEAGRGLDDATYYMELIVPQDFTADIASADTKTPEAAMLQVYFNPSTNLIAQTVGQSMVTKIKAELTGKISQEYFDQIFVKIDEAADKLQSAVDGAGELVDGLGKLEDGSGKLDSGLEKAHDGAGSLDAGIGKLESGSESLTDGLKRAKSGSKELGQGVKSAQAGSKKITDNMASLVSGAESLDAGIGQVGDGLGQLKSGIAASKQESAALSQALSAIGACLQQSPPNITTAQALVEGLKQANPTIGDDLYTYFMEIRNAGSDATRAAVAKAQFSSYVAGISNTAKLSASSVEELSAGVDKLYAAVTGDLATGSSALSAGAKKLQEGSSSLSSGLEAAAKGSDSLTSGISSAYSGSGKVTSGLASASDGAGSLVIGLGDAVSGSSKITSGLSSALDGADALESGLSDGQGEMAESAEGKDAKAAMMSEPVTANGENGTGESITQVANYGTGFAPYFIALGMWVGALMVSFLIRSLNSRILMSGASSTAAVLASYLPMAAVCVVQAMLLLLFIQFGLGMEVKYPAAYYLFGVLTALAFAAIIQFFRAALGTVGMVVIVVLLMLQLCTAAGTFPIESELPVFQALNPWLPMTYVVGGFRMAMAGLSLSYMGPDVAALAVFTAAFLCLTLLLARHRRRASMSALYPPIQLAG